MANRGKDHEGNARSNAQGTSKLLRRLLVAESDTLRTALKVLDATSQAIVFVRDREERVLGTLTDGDIRRAFLAGATLESRCLTEAMRRDFAWVDARAGRVEVLDLMRARHINQIPALDESGRLVGLHSMREYFGSAPVRPNWGVLMAGGRGERLRPLTDRIPKPMIRVAGRPILERLLLHLVGSGIREIFISIGYLGHQIQDYFEDGERFGCRIRYLREDAPLGTGGALSLLPEKPKHPVLVINGDLVTEIDLSRLFRFHEAGSFVATMGVRPHEVEIPFGVAVARGKNLVALREKPAEQVLVNTGSYVLSPRAIRMIPPNEIFPITRLFEMCIDKKLPVGACPVTDEWSDVGQHDELRRARGER